LKSAYNFSLNLSFSQQNHFGMQEGECDFRNCDEMHTS